MTRESKSSHISRIFSDTEGLIKATVSVIKKEFPKCGGIVAPDGLSGSTLVIPVSVKLNKPFGFVRNKRSHSYISVERHTNINNVVIIDDLIQSGKTMKATIKKLLKIDIKPIGIVLYSMNYNKFFEPNFEYYKRANAKKPLIIPVQHI